MARDVSLSDSKCWNGGHEWVNYSVHSYAYKTHLLNLAIFEIDLGRRENSVCVAQAALAVLVVSTRVHIPVLSKEQREVSAAGTVDDHRLRGE